MAEIYGVGQLPEVSMTLTGLAGVEERPPPLATVKSYSAGVGPERGHGSHRDRPSRPGNLRYVRTALLGAILAWLIELATAGGAIGGGIALLNMPPNSTDKPPDYVAYLLIVVGVLILIIGSWRRLLDLLQRIASLWRKSGLKFQPPISRHSAQAPVDHPISVTPPAFGDEYTDATAHEIVQLARTANLTQVQRQGLLKPHMGKWLSLTGRVRDVIAHTDFIQVVLTHVDGDDQLGGTVKFRERNMERAAAFCCGKPLELRGVIESVTPDSITLDRAELRTADGIRALAV